MSTEISVRDGVLERHLDDFVRNGFTVIRGVFSDDEISRYLEANERIVTKVRKDPARYATRYTAHADDLTDTWGVNNIFEPGLYEPDLAGIFGHHGFMAFPRFVLGRHLRFWSAHSLWSPEHVDYELNWHKDNYEQHFDTTGAARHVQFNVCLTADSSFKAVPGSHRRRLTDAEQAQFDASGIDPLPGAVSVDCAPGDVIYMNYHTLHRGACSAGVHRRTLHMNVQSMAEQTGGQVTWDYMREPGYLDTVEPSLAVLMRRAIDWDDCHPIDRAEARRRMRVKRDVRNHVADGR